MHRAAAPRRREGARRSGGAGVSARPSSSPIGRVTATLAGAHGSRTHHAARSAAPQVLKTRGPTGTQPLRGDGIATRGDVPRDAPAAGAPPPQTPSISYYEIEGSPAARRAAPTVSIGPGLPQRASVSPSHSSRSAMN